MAVLKIKMNKQMNDFINKFKKEADKSPKEFELWYNNLHYTDRLLIDGYCNAVSLGLNDHMVDKSQFQKHAIDIENESREEDK